jgi:hypothetical protein
MTETVDGPAAGSTVPPLEIDMTYGGIYAGSSFEFSAALAAHVNATAARAGGLEPGEFREFVPGESFSIACPVQAVPRAQFIAAYGRLRAVIDGEVEIRLGDHPHLFASPADEPAMVRGNPTYIPKSILPAGFFGRPHSLELYQDDVRIFGPAERFFHTSSSGAVFNQIEDGHGQLVLEVRGDLGVLARHGEIVFFTDPAFGLPTAVTQLDDDGSSRPLEWQMLGRDRIGDATLFDEWVAVGVAPRGERVVLEVRLPNRGTGLAAALYSGHTRDTAFRADATVL